MPEEIGRTYGQAAFLKDHFCVDFAAPKVDLTGRTVLVTGGNTGLGYAAVLHFARANASRIIITSRAHSRSAAAAAKVYQDVPGYKGVVDTLELDLGSFASVIAFCQAVRDDEGRLDIVIANAGVARGFYEQTSDGFESDLQVNGIATALMALLLMPKLEETAGLDVPQGSRGMKPAMSIVASDVHFWVAFRQKDATGSLLDTLNDPKEFISSEERYSLSKLLSIFNARQLAKLPAVTSGKVIVNSTNPGLCVSDLLSDYPPLVSRMINAVAWSAEKGTRNFLYSATQNTSPGANIAQCSEMAPSKFVCSDKGQATQEKYWRECMEIFKRLEVGPGLVDALRAC